MAPDTAGTPRQAADKLGECMVPDQGGSGYEVGKSAGAAGAKPYTRVSRFIQALSAGFTPLAVPLPDACCLPLTSLLTCGLFRQLLHS